MREAQGKRAMRILFLTNFYPPFALGGQGQSCEQVVEGLRERGHETIVLTSDYRVDPAAAGNSPRVHRSLHLEMDMAPLRHAITFFTGRKRQEQENLDRLAHLVDEFNPDIIFIWGMWNLHRSLPALAETLRPGRVVYRFAEYWPTLPSQHYLYWQASGQTKWRELPKRMLGKLALAMLDRDPPQPALRFQHAYCVSQATKDRLVAEGIPVQHARVIHTGLPLTRFLGGREGTAKDRAQRLKALYAGRISREKGVHTAIEALGKLPALTEAGAVSLSVAGSGREDYLAELNARVRTLSLEGAVRFLGRIPAAEMPATYTDHDVLLVPSIWPEPFARVVLEGMASGLVVVATTAGGSGEIVEDGVNGLLFAPGDADALALMIQTLQADPALRRRLAEAGRNTVLQGYTVERMLEEIEDFLEEIYQADDRAQDDSRDPRPVSSHA